MESTYGAVLTLFISLAFAIPIGMLVRINIWVAIGLNGVFLGYLAGGLAYILVFLVCLNWNSFIGMIISTVIFAILGGVLAF